MQITFYTTDGCTLCSEALDLLFSLKQLRGHDLVTVDIAAEEHLLASLGPVIPVLELNGHRLQAPLDLPRVTAFLQTHLS